VRAEPRQDAGGEPGSGGAVFLVAGGTDDLMQGPERQPAARQGRIDRVCPERQHTMPRRLFQTPDMVAERGQGGGAGHNPRNAAVGQNVSYLFLSASIVNPPGFLR
jgi:hypothetical protein